MIPWKILTQDEVTMIHHATLRVLSEVGIRLDHPGTVAILTDHGATININRIRIPPDLVEDALRRCPSQVVIRGHNGKEVVLGDGSLH